jgi:CIC family chloride channel protein
MERHFIVSEAGTALKEAVLPEDIDDVRAIVVAREGRIVGLIPPRSGLWLEARSNPDVRIEGYVEAQLVICREDDLLSVVFARLRRHRAGAAIVFRGTSRPRVNDVVGIITKRAIADEVIHSYQD